MMEETTGKKEFNSFSYKVRMILTSIIQWYRWKKCRLQGYDIEKGTQLERNLNLDRINQGGVHIGKDCIITSGVSIYAHKLVPHKYTDKKGVTRVSYDGYKVDTYIGDGCVLGIKSIILGGVRIGNNCVVGAGAVVSKDVPDNCVVAGNPARIIKENINYDGYII